MWLPDWPGACHARANSDFVLDCFAPFWAFRGAAGEPKSSVSCLRGAARDPRSSVSGFRGSPKWVILEPEIRASGFLLGPGMAPLPDPSITLSKDGLGRYGNAAF